MIDDDIITSQLTMSTDASLSNPTVWPFEESLLNPFRVCAARIHNSPCWLNPKLLTLVADVTAKL
jgi:hypothetical protein